MDQCARRFVDERLSAHDGQVLHALVDATFQVIVSRPDGFDLDADQTCLRSEKYVQAITRQERVLRLRVERVLQAEQLRPGLDIEAQLLVLLGLAATPAVAFVFAVA